MVERITFPTDVGTQNFRVPHDRFMQHIEQLLTADLQQRFAFGVLHADDGVGRGQSGGRVERRFQFALNVAGLRSGNGRQALFDGLLELCTGALLHQRLRAGA